MYLKIKGGDSMKTFKLTDRVTVTELTEFLDNIEELNHGTVLDESKLPRINCIEELCDKLKNSENVIKLDASDVKDRECLWLLLVDINPHCKLSLYERAIFDRLSRLSDRVSMFKSRNGDTIRFSFEILDVWI